MFILPPFKPNTRACTILKNEKDSQNELIIKVGKNGALIYLKDNGVQ
jgi:hypothetical protein